MHTDRSPKLPTTLNRSETTALKHKKLRFASTTPDRKLFNVAAENPSLGPGTYEIKSTLQLNHGFTFQAHGKEDDKDKDVPSTQPITGFRYSYLDNPGPGYYPQYTTLDSKGYSFPSAMSKREELNESPGPGRYFLSARTSGLGYFFSPIPRFDQSPIEKLACASHAAYTPRLHNVSKEDKEKIRRRIVENKDLSRFSPKERAKSLQRLASTHAKKLDLTRSIKLLRDEERHHFRLMRLDEKISKMELRLNRHPKRERVADAIELNLVQAKLKTLLDKWIKNKEFIREHILRFMDRRRRQIDQIMKKLQKIESDALNPSSQKSKIFPDIAVARLAFESVSVETRRKEISHLIGIRTQTYCQHLIVQQKAVNSFHELVQSSLEKKQYIDDYEIDLSSAVSINAKPCLDLEFTRKDLEMMAMELVAKNPAFNVFPKPRRNTKHTPHFRPRAASKPHKL